MAESLESNKFSVSNEWSMEFKISASEEQSQNLNNWKIISKNCSLKFDFKKEKSLKKRAKSFFKSHLLKA